MALTAKEYMQKVEHHARLDLGKLKRELRSKHQIPTKNALEAAQQKLAAKWIKDYVENRPANTPDGTPELDEAQKAALRKKLNETAMGIFALNRMRQMPTGKVVEMTPDAQHAAIGGAPLPQGVKSYAVKTGLFKTTRGMFSVGEDSINVKIKQQSNTAKTTTLVDYKEVIVAAVAQAKAEGWKQMSFDAQSVEVARLIVAAGIAEGIQVDVPAHFAADPEIQQTIQHGVRSVDGAAQTLKDHLGEEVEPADVRGHRVGTEAPQAGGGGMEELLRGAQQPNMDGPPLPGPRISDHTGG